MPAKNLPLLVSDGGDDTSPNRHCLWFPSSVTVSSNMGPLSHVITPSDVSSATSSPASFLCSRRKCLKGDNKDGGYVRRCIAGTVHTKSECSTVKNLQTAALMIMSKHYFMPLGSLSFLLCLRCIFLLFLFCLSTMMTAQASSLLQSCHSCL